MAPSAAEEWSRQLPRLVAECAERWDLAVGDRLAGGLVGHVVACTTSAGEAAVLKLNPPASAGQPATPEQEAAALRAWGGRGAVELLAFAPDLRALLTRRALPGTPLAAGSDRRARREVARVLADLFGAAVPSDPSRGSTAPPTTTWPRSARPPARQRPPSDRSWRRHAPRLRASPTPRPPRCCSTAT